MTRNQVVLEFDIQITVVFVLERASREYLARPNQILREEVIAIIRKSRSTKRNARPSILPIRVAWSSVFVENHIFCPKSLHGRTSGP